jgi:hypothetical protein
VGKGLAEEDGDREVVLDALEEPVSAGVTEGFAVALV